MTDEELRDKFLREKGALQIPPAMTLYSVMMEGYYYDADGHLKHVATKGTSRRDNAVRKVNKWARERLQQRLANLERRKA